MWNSCVDRVANQRRYRRVRFVGKTLEQPFVGGGCSERNQGRVVGPMFGVHRNQQRSVEIVSLMLGCEHKPFLDAIHLLIRKL